MQTDSQESGGLDCWSAEQGDQALQDDLEEPNLLASLHSSDDVVPVPSK